MKKYKYTVRNAYGAGVETYHKSFRRAIKVRNGHEGRGWDVIDNESGRVVEEVNGRPMFVD